MRVVRFGRILGWIVPAILQRSPEMLLRPGEDVELEMGEGRKELGGLHVVFIGLCGSGT